MENMEIKTPAPIEGLQTEPEFFDKLNVSADIIQTFAWLMGWTGSSRKLIRCDEQGGLFVSPIRGLYRQSTQIEQLTVQDTWTNIAGIPANTAMVEIICPTAACTFRIYSYDTTNYYTIACSGYRNICIPHKVTKITVNTFPVATGAASTIGLSCFTA